MSDIDRGTDRAGRRCKMVAVAVAELRGLAVDDAAAVGGGCSPVGVAEYGAQGSEDVYFPG